MTRKFKIEYISRDDYKSRCNTSDSLVIENLGVIEVEDKRSINIESTIAAKVFKIIDENKDWRFKERLTDIYDLREYLGIYDYGTVERRLKDYINKYGMRIFIQFENDNSTFSNHLEGSGARGFVNSSGWALVNVQELPKTKEEELEIEICNLKKEINKLKKEIKYIKDNMVSSYNG